MPNALRMMLQYCTLPSVVKWTWSDKKWVRYKTLIVDLLKKGIPKVITSSLMILQIKINNLCQHSVKCPRYIPSHKLNQLNWVKTGSDIVFLIFLIYLQTMPNMCKYLEMIRPTLYFSFARLNCTNWLKTGEDTIFSYVNKAKQCQTLSQWFSNNVLSHL
jgi:hypothetical protein